MKDSLVIDRSNEQYAFPLDNPSLSFIQQKYEVRHHFFKRLFDICFSASVLVIGLPIFIVIALLIKISSKGTIFYSQLRLGRCGVPFKCYKFRTMYQNAETVLDNILLSDPSLQVEWRKKQKLKHDPRIFPIGKWLRKTSLDELPQFWNVLIGDLSIVGPRPYMVHQRQDLGTRISTILSIRPGITGLWQTSGRSRTTFQKRILLDEHYVLRRSFLLDVFLILKTVPSIVLNQDAY